MKLEKITVIGDFIKNFVQKHKQERCLFELTSAKKRSKFINRLNHTAVQLFDGKYMTRIDKADDFPDKITALLKFKSDELVYVISHNEAYDDKFLPFFEAFEHVYSAGLAGLVVNIAGNTFFLVAEQEIGTAPKYVGRRK